MGFTSRTFKATSLTAVLALSFSLFSAPRADAAIGLLIQLTAKNETMKTIGTILLGVGGATTLVGLVGGAPPPTTQQCSPGNPCACTISTGGSDRSPGCQGAISANTCNGYDDEGYCTGYNGSITSGSVTTPGALGDPIPRVLNIGLGILGTDAAPTLAFSPIDTASAIQLGISASQQGAFNHELPEINLIANTFLSQLNQEVAQGVKDAQLTQDSKTLWSSQAKPMLSSDAYAALQKASAAYSVLF